MSYKYSLKLAVEIVKKNVKWLKNNNYFKRINKKFDKYIKDNKKYIYKTRS